MEEDEAEECNDRQHHNTFKSWSDRGHSLLVSRCYKQSEKSDDTVAAAFGGGGAGNARKGVGWGCGWGWCGVEGGLGAERQHLRTWRESALWYLAQQAHNEGQ